MTKRALTPLKIPTGLQDALDYMQVWMPYLREAQRWPGLAVCVRWKGREVFHGEWGEADPRTGEKLTEEHLWRVASQSKSVLATLVLQLVEQKKLGLDDAVWPRIAPRGMKVADARLREVTVRQLLSHSGGLSRDGEDAQWWLYEKDFPDAQGLLEEMARLRLVLEPNTQFKYTNVGFSLLGLLVEAVANRPVAELAAELWAKAGVEAYWDAPFAKGKKLVAGEAGPSPALGGKKIWCDPFTATRALAPATGAVSSPRAQAAFYDALLLRKDLLKPATLREMVRVQWEIDGMDGKEAYGMGLSLMRDGKNKLWGHGGSFNGQMSRTMTDINKGLVVSVAANTQNMASRGLIKGILNLLAKGLDGGVGKGKPYDGCGRYAEEWSGCDMRRLGKDYYLLNPEAYDCVGVNEPLKPVKKDVFAFGEVNGYASAGETVRFVRDGKGKIVYVLFGAYRAYPEALARAQLAGRLMD